MEGKLIKTDGSYCLTVIHERIGNMIIATDNKDLNKMLNYPYTISLKNCEVVANGYDLDKFVEDNFKGLRDCISDSDIAEFYISLVKTTVTEILGDKKFTEEEVRILICNERYFGMKPVDVIQSLQPNEFDVEIEMEEVYDGLDEMAQKQYRRQPKLDANNCLILKRK